MVTRFKVSALGEFGAHSGVPRPMVAEPASDPTVWPAGGGGDGEVGGLVLCFSLTDLKAAAVVEAEPPFPTVRSPTPQPPRCQLTPERGHTATLVISEEWDFQSEPSWSSHGAFFLTAVHSTAINLGN